VRVLAIYSIKGGVGKTSTAVNLAYAASQDLGRVLLWDLDPQGASTFYFRVRPKVKGGISQLLRRKRSLGRYARGTDYTHLDLVPADRSYRYADLVLDGLKKPRRGVGKVLKPLRDEYDYVLLDCPPSLSLLSESVFRAAEALVVPVVPTTLSLLTLEQLAQSCTERLGRGLTILPFFSMVDRRKGLHRSIVAALPEERPEMLHTQIPYSSLVEQMGVHRAPLGSFAASSPVAARYAELWREIRTRLETPSDPRA
jgi:chromosome partitioning protein